MKKTAIIANYGKTKIGTVLISLFNGTPFIVTGGKKGVGSGPAHLASMLHGWNYTGEQVHVNNYHDITDDELNQICGGHLDMFRKAQTDDVIIECIELNDMQIRESKSKNDLKNGIANENQNADETKKKSADERIADAEKEGVPIWSIFGIEKSRAEILIKEFNLHWKKIESNSVDVMTKELADTGTLRVHILPHHIHDIFECLPSNEYGFVMFICGQSFYGLQKKMESFADSPFGKLARVFAKKS